MRIKLKRGYQKRLILLAKRNLTWMELSSLLKINSSYLSNELRNEERFISYELYNKLCNITKLNYDIYINREDKKRGHYLIILNTLDDIVDVMDTGTSDASQNKRISIKRLERSLVHTPIDYRIIFV